MSLTRQAKMEVLRVSIRKVTRLLTKSKLPVIMAGTQAKVTYNTATGKPTAVYLPSLPDNSSETLIDAIQGFVDHEVAHVLFSDFDCLMEGNRMKIPMLLNAAEDTFIERKINEVYEGTKSNVAKMRDLFIDKFIEPAVQKAKADGVTDFKKWWGILGVCAMRAWAGHLEFELYMDDKWELLGNIPKLAEDKKIPERLKAIENTKDSLKVAIRISHIVKEAEEMPEKPEEEEEPEESEESDEDDDADEESEEGDPEEAEGDPEESGESGEDESDGEPEEDSEDESDGKGSGKGESESEKDESDEESDGDDYHPDESEEKEEKESEGVKPNPKKDEDSKKPEESGDEEYDEPPPGFDGDDDFKGVEDFLEEVISEEAKAATDASDYLPYTRDADIIEPLEDSDKVPSTEIDTMEGEIKQHIAPVQRALANAFESRNRTFQMHGKRSGRLSGPSLHRLVSNDERVYFQNKEARTRDSAVQLVIDISGSMSGAKVRLAAQVGWAVTEVLDRLKVHCEVICFTQEGLGWGTSRKAGPFKDYDEEMGKSGAKFTRAGPIYMPIIKSWDEPHFTQMHKRHFTRMGNSQLRMQGNVDGESIQYAALRLLKQKEPGKVMIVLSDGQPAGDGDHHKFVAHLKQSVKDIERSGINVMGIGIMDSSVKNYYPKHVVVNKLEDLAGTVMGKIRDALLKS